MTDKQHLSERIAALAENELIGVQVHVETATGHISKSAGVCAADLNTFLAFVRTHDEAHALPTVYRPARPSEVAQQLPQDHETGLGDIETYGKYSNVAAA